MITEERVLELLKETCKSEFKASYERFDRILIDIKIGYRYIKIRVGDSVFEAMVMDFEKYTSMGRRPFREMEARLCDRMELTIQDDLNYKYLMENSPFDIFHVFDIVDDLNGIVTIQAKTEHGAFSKDFSLCNYNSDIYNGRQFGTFFNAMYEHFFDAGVLK